MNTKGALKWRFLFIIFVPCMWMTGKQTATRHIWINYPLFIFFLLLTNFIHFKNILRLLEAGNIQVFAGWVVLTRFRGKELAPNEGTLHHLYSWGLEPNREAHNVWGRTVGRATVHSRLILLTRTYLLMFSFVDQCLSFCFPQSQAGFSPATGLNVAQHAQTTAVRSNARSRAAPRGRHRGGAFRNSRPS